MAEWIQAFAAVISTYFLWAQTRILRREPAVPTAHYILRYWPLFSMGIMVLLLWAAVGYDIYERHHPINSSSVSSPSGKMTTEIGIQSVLGTNRRPMYYSLGDLGVPIHALKEIRGNHTIA
jgi:hypothetical protein